MTVFFRVLAAPVQDKASELRAAVGGLAAGDDVANCFEDDADSFARIPGAPLSYWVPLTIRQLFATEQRFEGDGRVARTTNNIEDNFRFVRLAWEVSESDAWRPWAKGSTRRFYSDIDCVVACELVAVRYDNTRQRGFTAHEADRRTWQCTRRDNAALSTSGDRRSW